MRSSSLTQLQQAPWQHIYFFPPLFFNPAPPKAPLPAALAFSSFKAWTQKALD